MKSTPTLKSNSLVKISIDSIIPDPEQPRKIIKEDSLQELSRSIMSTGQINPLTVRPKVDGKYMIIVGERRYKAAVAADLKHIDCIIRDVDDQKAKEMQLAENHQRDDIDPLDQAEFMRDYLNKYDISQNELSKRTGIPQRTISDRLTLLSLPVSVHANMREGLIGPYEAVKISKFSSDKQAAVADAVVSGGIGGAKLDKLLDLERRYPDKSIEEVIQGIDNESKILGQTEGTDVTEGAEEKEQDYEDWKQIHQLSNKETSVLFSVMVDFMHRLTIYKKSSCSYFDEKTKTCSIYGWNTMEQVPESAGIPKRCGDLWRVDPFIPTCAFCVAGDKGFNSTILDLLSDPFAFMRFGFKCNCGAIEKLAVVGKCIGCGKEILITDAKNIVDA